MSKQKHEELLVANDIATWTHLDPQTIRRMTRRGEIPGAINLGTERRPLWRYDPQQVAAWMCAR